MQNYTLKSAKEIQALVQANPELKQSALEYALQKAAFLQSKGKNMRAKLWHRLCAELGAEQAVVQESQPKAQGCTVYTDEERRAMGMTKRKVNGATMWVWPTPHWYTPSVPKASKCSKSMAQAYEAWKAGQPLKYASN